MLLCSISDYLIHQPNILGDYILCAICETASVMPEVLAPNVRAQFAKRLKIIRTQRGFDRARYFGQLGQLDRALARFGPETKEARALLRAGFASAVEVISGDNARMAKLDSAERMLRAERFQDKLWELAPRNDAQRSLQSRAAELSNELQQTRWLLIQQGEGSIPTPFLVVLVLWLAILFAGFGLLSARNATVVATLVICALSVSGAIFLIEEMNRPLEGLMKISGAPLRNALDHLGQ
jgi:hypothetical protein